MPIFRNDTFRIQRELRALRAQLSAVTAERDALDRALAESARDLARATATVPANLSDVTHFLRAFVPSLPMAPGFNLLTAATDPKSYAQALHLLLLHARQVGHQEAPR